MSTRSLLTTGAGPTGTGAVSAEPHAPQSAAADNPIVLMMVRVLCNACSESLERSGDSSVATNDAALRRDLLTVPPLAVRATTEFSVTYTAPITAASPEGVRWYSRAQAERMARQALS